MAEKRLHTIERFMFVNGTLTLPGKNFSYYSVDDPKYRNYEVYWVDRDGFGPCVKIEHKNGFPCAYVYPQGYEIITKPYPKTDKKVTKTPTSKK